MINSFDLATTRRLAVALLAATGAFLFAAFDLIGAGISANDKVYAAKVSEAILPLLQSLVFGTLAFISAEFAGHEKTPAEGHPHSKRNYLETAFVLISVVGLGSLAYGAFKLISAAIVRI